MARGRDQLVVRRPALLTATVLLATAAIGFAPLPQAHAASCAPPGDAGVDQYFETLPGANCSTTSHRGRPRGSHPAGVSASTAQALAADGAAGQTVLSLVAAGPAAASSSSGARPLPAATATTSVALPGGAGGLLTGSSTPTAPHGARPAAASGNGAPPQGPGLPVALLEPIATGSADAGGVGWLLPVTLGAALAVTVMLLLRRAPSTPRIDPRRWVSTRTATPIARRDAATLRPDISPGCEQVESIHPREADHAKLHEPSGVREADAGCTDFREP